MNDYVLNDYFEWLYMKVAKKTSYRKLIMQLHDIEFRYHVDYDVNRAMDGMNLRWYYVDDGGDDAILQWKAPCSVLEMLIALAMHMESILDEPDNQYDIYYWFWYFMFNLDLEDMQDAYFEKAYVYGRVAIFMDRKYDPDGEGNIIYIPDCSDDLRSMEIWHQMCWYIDSII